MATITPQTGSTPTLAYVAATAGGDTVAFGNSTGKPLILVRNASAGSVTVTLTGAVNCSQGFSHNTPVTCAVGDTAIVPPASAIDASSTATRGNVALTYSAVASVTVAAVAS